MKNAPAKAIITGRGRLASLCSAACSTGLNAQQLAIYLNTNDCINCTSAVGQLPLIQPSIPVTIYADEAKRRFTPDVLARYGIVPGERWKLEYIPTKDLLAQAPVASECRFSTKGKDDLHFALKEIGGYISSMNVQARRYTERIRLPLKDTLLLSDRSSFFISGDKVVVTDYLLGDAFTLDMNSASPLKAARVAFPARFKREYMAAIGLDTLRYDSLRLIMDNMGKEKLAVQSANFSGDTMQLLVDVFYPDRDPEDSTSTMIQNYRCFASFLGQQLVGWRRCDWSMPDSMRTYLQYPDEAFHLGPRELITPMAVVPAGPEPPLLFGRYAFTDRSMHFTGLLDARLPAEAKREGRKDVIYSFGVKDDLLFVRCYPYFYDISDGHGYDLSQAISNKHKHFFFEKEEVRYWTEDAQWMDEGTLMVIYNRNSANETGLAWIDIRNDKVVRRVPIPKEDIVLSSLRILKDGRIMALSKDYDAFLIRQ